MPGMGPLMPDMQITPEQIQLGVTYATRVVGVLLLLFIANIVASWVRRLVIGSLEKAKFDATLTKFFSNPARYTVLILAVLAALGVFGIETTSFAAVIGAAGLAVGLAFQGTLSNFSAGVMLLAFRPFRVGDYINAAGTAGTVESIELFTTRLVTPDKRLIIVPNSAVFGSTIENVTYFDTRRVNVDVGTDYGADLQKTREVLEKVANSVEGRIDDPASQVYLLQLGGSSVDWTVRVWCNTADFWAVKERLTRDVKNALDEAGIGIPFPQQDVHLDPDVIEALKSK